MRLLILTVLSVVAMAASVLYASHAQRTTADAHGLEAELTQSVLADVNRSDAAISAFVLTGHREALQDRAKAAARLRQAAVEAAGLAANPVEHAAAERQRRLIARFDDLVERDLTARDRRAALLAGTWRRHELVDAITQANAELRRHQVARARDEDRRASFIPPLLIVVLSLVFAAAAAVIRGRSVQAAHRAGARRAVQQRFGEAMQVAASQPEAHGLLKDHLERSIPGTTVTVLNRNNSADRLEATTPLPEDSKLGESLQQARPRSCLAVRLSRPFAQGAGSEEIMSCEICGRLETASTCQPLLVGGEVIGSVLTQHEGDLEEDDAERISESVSQSGPVLANLRNLAIAEIRAATDALTGLPNRRAVDDTLLRMLAQAGRSFSPLSVILLDLDHFKAINDTYGHDRGDEVLAAFGARLREVLRASDFAGRSGGEEFVVFLPDTDRTGAIRLAEKIRAVMRGLSVAGTERDVTASFGVACFPDDAVEADALMRCADRALYAAKRGGRDRIEASSTGAPISA